MSRRLVLLSLVSVGVVAFVLLVAGHEHEPLATVDSESPPPTSDRSSSSRSSRSGSIARGPDVGSAVTLRESAAFPSGHATAGVASLSALVVLAAERLPSRRARTWLWAGVVVLGVTVALSRIALSVHYVTDFLAGWCLGLAWLAACLLLRDALRSRRASAALG